MHGVYLLRLESKISKGGLMLRTLALSTANLFAVMAVCIAQEQTPEEPKELTRLRQSYDRQCEKALLPVKTEYGRQLAILQARFTKFGKLEAALAVKREREALSAKSVARVSSKSKNIASEGRVSVSSEQSDRHKGRNVVDGMEDGGEWASRFEGSPWVKIEFAKPRSVTEVVLYDRPNMTDNVMEATVTCSDGTTLAVGRLENDGSSGTKVSFGRKRTVKWIKVTIDEAEGPCPGFAEVEIHGQ
jgi:hypothetical protein